MKDIKYTLYIYQGDKVNAFSVGMYSMEDEKLTDEVKMIASRFIYEILEGLKHTNVIEDYDVGVNVTKWPQSKLTI